MHNTSSLLWVAGRESLKSIARLLLLFGLLGLGVRARAGETTLSPARRLSVADVGQAKKVPAAFVDLLDVAFVGQKDFILLERAEIDRLLREQKIGLLSAGDINPEEAVKAGRLLAVDVFLLLEASESEGKQIQVRVRLVDTRYGIKLQDFQFLLPAPTDYEAFAATLVGKTRSQLAQIKDSADQMRLIGVIGFKSLEPSPKWNYLAEALQAGTSRILRAPRFLPTA